MKFPRYLFLTVATALISSLLRADVNEFNNNPCTYKVVVVKQYIFINSVLTNCPTFEASVGYGSYLSITNYYQSGPGYTYEIRYETQYAYYTPASAASFSNSLIHVPLAPAAPITNATVTIAAGVDMSQVSFSSTNTQRFEVLVVSTDPNARTMSLWLIPMSATPANAPNGDANIRVHYGQNQTCLGPVVVCVKPTTQEQFNYTSGQASALNWSESPSSNTQLLWTKVKRDITIKIRDQFSNLLHASFNGTQVVNEIFSNSGPVLIPPQHPVFQNGELPIILPPPGNLINGELPDECGFQWFMTLQPPGLLNQAGLNAWSNGTLGFMHKGTPIYNVFQSLGNFSTSTDMQVKVRGTLLTNKYRRTFNHLAGSPPNVHITHQVLP